MSAFLWALIAAFVWGIVPLFEKAGLAKVEPMVGLFYRSLGVILGVVLLGTVILKPAQLKTIDPRSAAFLIIGGFLASFIAVIAYYHGLKIGEVSLVVPVAASFYLITFVLGVLFLGETLTLLKVFAVALITVGLWILRSAA